METLEIHSKDFLVKWVHAADNSTIDWQVKPLKKSINFTIYRKNDLIPNNDTSTSIDSVASDDNTVAPSQPSSSSINIASPANDVASTSMNASNSTLGSHNGNTHTNNSSVNNNSNNTLAAPPRLSKNRLRSSSVASVNQFTDLNVYKTKSRSSTLSSNLNSADLKLIKDYHKLIADELVHGKFEVTKGGMYAFVFDNSFSKTTGKKVLFSTKILLANTDGSPPKHSGSIHRRKLDNSFKLGGLNRNVSFQNKDHPSKEASELNIPLPDNNEHNGSSEHSNIIQASNDPPSQPLQATNILRPKNGELLQSVLLKRRRKKLQGFTKRFFILNFKYGTLSYFKLNDNKLRGQMPIKHSIVSANAKSREIIIDSGMEVWDLKALNNDDFKAWISAFNEIKKSQYSENNEESAIDTNANLDSHDEDESESNDQVINQLRTISDKLDRLKLDITNSSPNALATSINGINLDVHGLINHFKPHQSKQVNNDAISVFSSNDFYDAKEYIDAMNSGVVLINGQNTNHNTRQNGQTLLNTGGYNNQMSDEEDDEDDEEYEDDDQVDAVSSSTSATSDSEDGPSIMTETSKSAKDVITNVSTIDNDFNLYPLPHEPVKREFDIPVCTHEPPSILAFVRKNVGKDLSSIAMPVDMNEPVNILQKYAELIEYSELVNNAIQANADESSGERILRIASFAVSSLSSMRMKERNSRKPFNPLLGETFELVREDFGIRLISEKVCHRPPVFAMFVEAEDWTLSFSPAPSQKFWGKNAEISTKGTVKLVIKATGETFSWNQPTSLLKNIIAGEKYTEPSSPITVKSSSGQRAVVEFAKGGMFSGRSEDLTIKAFDSSKKELSCSVNGKWTESLTLKSNNLEKVIWTCGELLPNATKKFGFTKFAGTLNKISEMERGNLPPTDSRLRPDMKVYEQGKIEEAEALKNKLEEDQRHRRREYEHSGKKYEPKFFHHVGSGHHADHHPDSGEWVYTTGENSYWNRRKNQNWNDLPQMW